MSKILDILNNVTEKKHAHTQALQDEIAKTYFHKKSGKWGPGLPWLVAAIAILFALAMFLLKSNIDIKVRVLGEIPIPAQASAGFGPAEKFDKGIFLIKGGEPNKDIIKNVYFAGDGKEFSAAKPEELMLCNTRGSGWANYTIEFKDAIDLNKFDIKYAAKGATEYEYLTLVIVDSSNRSYRIQKDISSALSKEWQRYTVNFRRFGKAVDLSNVLKIKFEFGSLTAGNYPNALMFLKDVYITRARRLEWL